MRLKDTIARLQAAEAAIRAMGVMHLFLFGSVARDTASAASDIDLFFDRDPSKPFGLFELVALEEELKSVLGNEVDVGTRKSLHPAIRADVETNAVQVF